MYPRCSQSQDVPSPFLSAPTLHSQPQLQPIAAFWQRVKTSLRPTQEGDVVGCRGFWGLP